MTVSAEATKWKRNRECCLITIGRNQVLVEDKRKRCGHLCLDRKTCSKESRPFLRGACEELKDNGVVLRDVKDLLHEEIVKRIGRQK